MNASSSNKDRRRPIGIFDSGIGGLTVANAIFNACPQEHLIYFGDTAHLPYGDKSADAIRYYSIKISKFLMDQGCKMIVIACNSASSAAYETLVDFFEGKVHFVNVVDPLVNYLAHQHHKDIGIIATKATIASEVYQKKIKEKLPDTKVHALATPLLVPMIEEGFFEGKVSHSIIHTYLSNPPFEHIDALLLACTHYPLIKEEIQSFFKQRVEILDSTEVTAKEVLRILIEEQLFNDKRTQENQFYVSDYTSSFEQTAQIFYGRNLNLMRASIW